MGDLHSLLNPLDYKMKASAVEGNSDGSDPTDFLCTDGESAKQKYNWEKQKITKF